MKIKNLFETKKVVLSYEIFPPQPSYPVETIYSTLDALKGLTPDYISITYGAGASSAGDRTAALADKVRSLGITPLPHITCIHSSKEEIAARLDGLAAMGIENILALRGDRKNGTEPANDFKYASDLAKFISANYDLSISGACYPEGHFECGNPDKDIDNLKLKTDAGVSHLNTQLFFDNGDFYRFIEKIRKKGINVPVQAGIMPVTDKKQLERIISLAGVKIPSKFSKIVARYGGSDEDLKAAGTAYACGQIIDLIENGVQGIHLYIMNNAALAKKISENISSAEEKANSKNNFAQKQ